MGFSPGNALFRFAICLCWLKVVSAVVYDWTRAEIDYPSKDMFLHVVPLKVTQNRFVVTQCAMDCLKDGRCKSYNFLSAPGVCMLNDKSHHDVPTTSLLKNTTSEYYVRETFSIDPLALGLCTGVTCENEGQCIETTDSQGTDIFLCVCVQGWTGDHCQTQVPWPSWGTWAGWGACSVTCGLGWRLRTRKCLDGQTGGITDPLRCHGRDTDVDECDLQECPHWNHWGDWGACSTETTCGKGRRTRSRTCSNGGTPGVDRYCMGPLNQTGFCQSIDCKAPVRLQDGPTFGEGRVELFNDLTGSWGSICADQWDLNAANTACLQMGFSAASEVVTDGRYGIGAGTITLSDISCPSTGRRVQGCHHSVWSADAECTGGSAAGVKCKVDGDWNMWTSWGTCSVTCEGGIETRTRVCDLPPALHGGEPCAGPGIEQRACTQPPCPGSGTWGNWGPWEACDVSCGEGSQRRYRICVDTVSCSGVTEETQACSTNVPCPVNGLWQQWSSWTQCDVTCGGGWRSRERNCTAPRHFGEECHGEARAVTDCNTQPCPVNGYWREWSSWSECTVSCGSGFRTRMRKCNPAKHGGINCIGVSEDTVSCNTHHCPVDGFWLEWSNWSVCSVPCGGGSQLRMRDCSPAKYGGANCSGSSNETRECNTHPCPVDGYWWQWSDWSPCSLLCGGGSQERTRHCVPGRHGGADCSGISSESQACNMHPCPVDGFWLEWSGWSVCSEACGNGSQSRMRGCNPGKHGGANCTGSSNETRDCNTHPCPVDGFWLPWSDWSVCTTACGNGSQVRMRNCNLGKHGGANCTGSSSESQQCNTHPCPVDGFWLEWSDWLVCSVSCGNGSQSRMRDCNPGKHGGANCSGSYNETQECNTHPCPVDGFWLPWSDWSDCTVSCGNGSRTRMRECFPSKHGGANCSGLTVEEQECNTHHCPVDGVWSTWSSWSDCSVTCGGGNQSRGRVCEGQRYGGDPCPGNATETQDCNLHPCPVDGVFQEWSVWGDCSLSCGGGTKMRTRECVEPQFGGKACEGSAEEEEVCNSHHCPVDGVWEDWSVWDTCSVTCGGGTRKRERVCTGTAHGGKECEGSDWEVEECSTNPCPVDGIFQDWSVWGDCSVSCGGGTKTRTRDCTPPQFGGADCVGELEEEDSCNTQPCPVDGVWEDWSIWDTCSVTCGGGTRKRERVCTGTAHGGKECEGSDWEVEECSTSPCPVDGEFTPWGAWGECSVTCGGGTRTRRRDCILPQYGGAPCDGDRFQIEDCGSENCPVDGRWNVWGTWSTCSETCGAGTQQRQRTCDGPYHGGNPCQGLGEEDRECQQPPCLIPGDWEPWSDWSSCSATCGGGTRRRSRQCDMTSHGELTAPCAGDPEEDEDCHIFPCQPYARSCSGLRTLGLMESVDADIDPDGPSGETPVRVFCDMEAQGGVGVTVIGHDQEEEIEVNGYEGAGEYDTGELVYNATWEQVLALVDLSASCRQFVSWKCKAALIHNHKRAQLDGQTKDYILTTFWRNRTGGVADYWGGAPPDSGSCDCGVTKTCADPTATCNCDSNDAVWREDAGYIKVKNDLPVTSFAAGDTGNLDEAGSVVIGPLQCFRELILQ